MPVSTCEQAHRDGRMTVLNTAWPDKTHCPETPPKTASQTRVVNVKNFIWVIFDQKYSLHRK